MMNVTNSDIYFSNFPPSIMFDQNYDIITQMIPPPHPPTKNLTKSCFGRANQTD